MDGLQACEAESRGSVTTGASQDPGRPLGANHGSRGSHLGLLHHAQLRQHADRLHVHAQRPQDLWHRRGCTVWGQASQRLVTFFFSWTGVNSKAGGERGTLSGSGWCVRGCAMPAMIRHGTACAAQQHGHPPSLSRPVLGAPRASSWHARGIVHGCAPVMLVARAVTG